MKRRYTILLIIALSICFILFFSLKNNHSVQEGSDQKHQKERTYKPLLPEKPIQKQKNTPRPQITQESDSLQKAKARKAYAKFLANHPYKKHQNMTYSELKAIPKAFRPDLAWEQDFLRTMDPKLGYVPYDRRLKALEKVSQDIKSKAAISGLNWTERGPNNIGGRTRALLFDPTDSTDRKVWAGGIQGGLWYTNNITIDTVWTKVDDLWDNISITAIAADPNDSLTWYVGTGEGFTAGGSSSTRGAGLWKTTDAGQNWTHMTSGNGFFSTDDDFHYVNDIIVRDEGGGTSALLVAVGRRTQRFFPFIFTQEVGLFRSTDGGVNFTQVLPNAPSSGRPYDPADLELDANNRIWIGTQDNTNGAGGGTIAYSSTGLSGSWTFIDFGAVNNADRVEVACSPSDPDVVYAVAENNSPGNSSQDVAWLRRTLNATDVTPTWEDVTIPTYLDQSCAASTDHFTRGQAFYNLILQFHPTDPDILIAGGISLHKSTNATTATVGDVSFDPVSYWTRGCLPFVHADEHQILFRPDHPNEAIIGSDGGVSYSTDLGSASSPNFANRNNSYNITQFYGADGVNAPASSVFLAGAQDNGSLQLDNGLTGAGLDVTGGDGGFCHIDQNNADIRITSFIRNVYFVSNDGGEVYNNVLNDQVNGSFINPTEYDDQAGILYANASDTVSIFRISDVGGMNTIDTLNINLLVNISDVTAIKASPHTNNRIFLGTEDGEIIRVDDANGTPTSTALNVTPFPTGSISSIDVGESDDELLVTFFNYGINSVWETVDGGTNWSNKEGNLPDIPIRWGLYNPLDREEVLLATELGVYSTDNFGTGTVANPVWGVSNTGLATVRCDMLQYRSTDGVVIVTTHGRGVFTTDIFAPALAEFEARQTWFVNRPLEFTSLSNQASSWAWDFDQNVNPGTDATQENPSFTYTSPGTYTVQLTINSGASTETKTNYITILEEPTVPYDQDFNTNDGGFFAYRLESAGNDGFEPEDWEWGANNSTNFSGAFATIEGAANWTTSLNEFHGFRTRYALESPPFSLVGATGDIFLNFNYRAATGTDAGFNVEYSTDGGNSWVLLGDTQGSPSNPTGTNNWYNESSLLGLRSQPGFNQALLTVFAPQYNITALSGESDVRFRFVFGSRDSQIDGVQIDNFQINGTIALPIRLLSFEGSRIDNQNVLLRWQTATEIDNKGFEIQQSFDAENFEPIAFVDGVGNSNTIESYQLRVKNTEDAYYRLKQVDLDGTTSLSNVVFVGGSVLETFKVYPNPSQGELNFELGDVDSSEKDLKLEVWDSQGALVLSLKGNQATLQKIFKENTLKFASGLYIIRIHTPNNIFTEKFIKQGY